MTSASAENIIRSWKDADFRDGLSYAEMANFPENPAGLVELSDEQLMSVDGGTSPVTPPVAAILISFISIEAIMTVARCC